jgi:hypothetical protein
VRLQYQFAIADVPSDTGIAKQAWRKNSTSHGHKQNDEDQISNGRKEKS